MECTDLSEKTQSYLSKLIRRRVISEASLSDQTLINYLCDKIIDEDFLHMKNYLHYREIINVGKAVHTVRA